MKRLSFLFCFLIHVSLISQSFNKNDTVLTAFEAYSQLPRELVFVHLNKSVYIKGEPIGYKAYVLDKATRKPSMQTNNLYCVLVDENEMVIKKQLIQITNGTGNGLFELDSLFTTGTYNFKAYTNWMRNFSEPNNFQQAISIIDPEITDEIKPETKKLKVDAQFLPESGQALEEVNAVFGAIIKDDRGYGIPFVEGNINDSAGETVANFKVNKLGIGRFAFIPAGNTAYFAEFTINNTDYKIPLESINKQGITCNLQDLGDGVGLTFNTRFRNGTNVIEPYMLTIHNGDSIKALEISFRDKNKVIRLIPKSNLYTGINVFTLFDPDGKPVLERLYFKHEGLEVLELSTLKNIKYKDSIRVNFSVDNIDPAFWNSLSISILPGETSAYLPGHNLPSHSMLNPYVKGQVENASYYFTQVTPLKKYELDNLLITQGWSSYDWNTVLTKPPQYLFDFEKGITYKVSINEKDSNRFLIFSSRNQDMEQVEIAEDQNEFSKDYFFPLDDQKFRISEINESGGMSPAKVFAQFKPSTIPPLRSGYQSLLEPKTWRILEETDLSLSDFETISILQKLEEVVLVEDRKKIRMEDIRIHSNGKVDFFEENDPRKNLFLSQYLQTQGYYVNEINGTFSIQAIRPNSFGSNQPLIFLDGLRLANYDILYLYTMSDVDYIEINKMGYGYGIMGGGGVINIVTDPLKNNNSGSSRSYNSYDIPLTFSSAKRYYTPVYNTYASTFYKTMGAIDWLPNIVLDADGNGQFTFYNYGLARIKIFIEGMINDHQFVSDIIDLKIQ